MEVTDITGFLKNDKVFKSIPFSRFTQSPEITETQKLDKGFSEFSAKMINRWPRQDVEQPVFSDAYEEPVPLPAPGPQSAPAPEQLREKDETIDWSIDEEIIKSISSNINKLKNAIMSNQTTTDVCEYISKLNKKPLVVYNEKFYKLFGTEFSEASGNRYIDIRKTINSGSREVYWVEKQDIMGLAPYYTKTLARTATVAQLREALVATGMARVYVNLKKKNDLVLEYNIVTDKYQLF